MNNSLKYMEKMSLDELKAFLSEIPSVKYHVESLIEKQRVADIIKTMPNELMEKFYLANTFEEGDKAVIAWCKKNITSTNDFVSVMKHFRIRPYYLPNGL